MQLELPLRSTPGRRTAPSRPEWRLDEQTRRVGRLGVAAARALLGEATTSIDNADQSEGLRGPAGRAA